MAAEAAVSYAVQTLGNILVEKVKLLRGVEREVLWLKDELKRMQSFLKDATEKQVNDERVRNWISEIRELALDSQDAIKMSILNAQKAGRSRLGLPEKFARFPSHGYRINKVGEEIESIRKKLQDIEISRQRYGILQDHPLQEGQADSSLRRRQENVERRRRLAHWEDDKDVVGLDEDAKLLLQKVVLEKRDQGLTIATIVGMGGIGKSTLARKIYNNAAVVEGFDCRVWVVVSSEFTPEKTMKQIMVKLQKSKEDEKKVRKSIKELEESTKDKLFLQRRLQEMLCKQLEGKRYFIILDDLWELRHWETLESAFPDQQEKTSVLLVTSRNTLIVRNAQYVHEMKCLGPEDSWNLFMKKAFIDNANDKCRDRLEYIGRKILEKCHGLPLAINVVGALLVEQKESISGWEKVLKGIHSHLGRGQSNVSTILELSYQNLNPQLKSCFLFLSLFREDAYIPAKKLVNVWIALDLVLQEDLGREETMEDIAQGYLDELINRNMLQMEEKTKDGRVKTCRIHDFQRELSIEKAKEEINLEILKEEGTSHSSRRPRHCAMNCSFRDLPTDQNSYLRSLFVHKMGEGGSLDPPSSFWKSFKLLNVLDMDDCGLRKLPDAIGTLFWLRYLGLRNTYINELPESMSKLENLQVLDSRGGYLRLPAFIWTMRSLRHLNSSEIWLSHPTLVNCAVENLQSLGDVVLEDDWMAEQLEKLTSLTKLGVILWSITEGKLFTSLALLKNLVSLSLKSFFTLNLVGVGALRKITKLKLEGCIDELPDAGDFPPNLAYLSLKCSRLKPDPMPVLAELPNLLSLKLDDDAYWGDEIEIRNEGFGKLHRGLPNLNNIKIWGGAMPELQNIFLQGLGNLSDIDAEKHSLPEQLRWEIKECLKSKYFEASEVSSHCH